MHSPRRAARVTADLAATLTTVLDSVEVRIIDLSEEGAQIVGAALPRGAKVQIEFVGQTVYAQCMWAEVDRMGVRFPFSLREGPLHDAMTMAARALRPVSARQALPAMQEHGQMPPLPLIASARRTGLPTFGRRAV